MTGIARFTLLISAITMIVYPLWGVFFPESYSLELTEHHSYADGFSMLQVSVSAAMLWIPNTVLAAAFLLLWIFLRNSRRTILAKIAGVCFIVYPIARTAAETLVALRMTEHVSDAAITVQFSSEKLFFMVFGLIVLGLVSMVSELNKGLKSHNSECA